jgi:hypothetical protein
MKTSNSNFAIGVLITVATTIFMAIIAILCISTYKTIKVTDDINIAKTKEIMAKHIADKKLFGICDDAWGQRIEIQIIYDKETHKEDKEKELEALIDVLPPGAKNVKILKGKWVSFEVEGVKVVQLVDYPTCQATEVKKVKMASRGPDGSRNTADDVKMEFNCNLIVRTWRGQDGKILWNQVNAIH